MQQADTNEAQHPDLKDYQQIDRAFTYHTASPLQVAQMADLRDRLGDLARTIIALVPPCRGRTVALTKLEEAQFFANAGIVPGLPEWVSPAQPDPPAVTDNPFLSPADRALFDARRIDTHSQE